MDPIQPISPRANAIPVERLERVSRERDRPPQERPQQRRRPPAAPEQSGEDPGEDGQQPRIDVRV